MEERETGLTEARKETGGIMKEKKKKGNKARKKPKRQRETGDIERDESREVNGKKE